MSTVIRVPKDLYIRLEKHAQGFDSPANVIEKMLNHYEGVVEETLERPLSQTVTKRRDTTKYIFNDYQFGKSKLVLAVVKKYIESNPEVTYENLLTIFPKSLQGSTGVFSELEATQEKFKDSNHKRHFMQDVICLKDCEIVVSTEWGIGNINKFIEKTEELGYQIIPTKN